MSVDCIEDEIIEVQTHSSLIPVLRKTDKGIHGDLSKMDFPSEVKDKANSIYYKLSPKTHRGNKRKLLVFYCVHIAYRELNITMNPISIANEVGISKSEMTKAISLFSPVQTGYLLEAKKTDPCELIPGYCRSVGLDEAIIDEVITMCKEVTRKDRNLLDEYPSTVAIGVIRYYFVITGAIINSKRFAKKMDLSEATINSIQKRIGEAYNT